MYISVEFITNNSKQLSLVPTGANVLLCCMYHHVGADKFSNTPALLEAHFRYIKDNFNVVLPGEPLKEDIANICIVFDDAGFSFYTYVFPLLKRIGLRVVLAVAPKFIVDADEAVAPHVRLRVPVDEMMVGDTFATANPFCTWKELAEISQSQLARIASHSYSHANLLKATNVEEEISNSKRILEKKLGQEVDIFVYPYGRFNASIAKRVHQQYTYSFSVGAGDNRTWDGIGGILFRIYADDLRDATSMFSRWNLRRYRLLRQRLVLKKWIMDRLLSAA